VLKKFVSHLDALSYDVSDGWADSYERRVSYAELTRVINHTTPSLDRPPTQSSLRTKAYNLYANRCDKKVTA